jgi:hypothetical protein
LNCTISFVVSMVEPFHSNSANFTLFSIWCTTHNKHRTIQIHAKICNVYVCSMEDKRIERGLKMKRVSFFFIFMTQLWIWI